MLHFKKQFISYLCIYLFIFNSLNLFANPLSLEDKEDLKWFIDECKISEMVEHFAEVESPSSPIDEADSVELIKHAISKYRSFKKKENREPVYPHEYFQLITILLEMFQLSEAAREDLISYSLESRRPCPELERLINSLYEAAENPETRFQIGIPASQILRESVLSSKVFNSLLEAFSTRDISKVQAILKKIDRKFFLRYMRTHQATFFRSIILDFFILLEQVKSYINTDELDIDPNEEEFNKSEILNFFEDQAKEIAYILKEMLETLSPSHANPLEEYNEETDLFIQMTDMFVTYIYIYLLEYDEYGEALEEQELLLDHLKDYTPYTSYMMGVLDYWRTQRQLNESPFGEPDLLTEDNPSPHNPIVAPDPQRFISDGDESANADPVLPRPEPRRSYGIGEGGHDTDEEDHDHDTTADEDEDTGTTEGEVEVRVSGASCVCS